MPQQATSPATQQQQQQQQVPAPDDNSPAIPRNGDHPATTPTSPRSTSLPHSTTATTSDSHGAPKQIMFIRHAEDELFDQRTVAEKFSTWHSSRLRKQSAEEGATIDPCLTDRGIAELTTGVNEDERRELNPMGYGGIQGGLGQIVRNFDPEVVFSSPMSRGLQSAIVAFDWSKAPIVVHYGLKEIKAGDYTKGGTMPRGKPGSRCLPVSYLKEAVSRHPRSSGGTVDWSIMDHGLSGRDDWFDAHEPNATMRVKLSQFVNCLLKRPESRIAVITHGGALRTLLGISVDHSEFAIVNLRDLAPAPASVAAATTPERAAQASSTSQTKAPFRPHINVDFSQPGCNKVVAFDIAQLSPGSRCIEDENGHTDVEHKKVRRAFKDAYAQKRMRLAHNTDSTPAQTSIALACSACTNTAPGTSTNTNTTSNPSAAVSNSSRPRNFDASSSAAAPNSRSSSSSGSGGGGGGIKGSAGAGSVAK
eukprot:INCI9742.1.p1 GENE.INCI9742.1~~INCI9742.1.p1  ORF type:complete len:477 (-),score=91.15 INCI9742.1:119-1549(-)